MNSLYILIGVIILIIIFYPNITISENQLYSPLSKDSNKLSTPRLYDFYIPQLTTEQKPLSNDNYNNQLNANMLTRNTYLNDDNVNIIRNELNNIENKYPKFLLKDTLSANTINSSELSPVDKENKSYKSFTDDNVSQYPKYYTSDLKNDITNIGKFFDKQNRYSDTTKSNSSAYVNDNCYIDSNNDITCLDNTRLQNIPPKNNDIYNGYDITKNPSNLKITSSKDSVMNGLSFYDNVFGSKDKNETFSPFLIDSTKECFIDL
tara:strand:- start:103 stop:891 length:789 start_codon:yes stop_codon:yes gene_type:complete